MAMTETSIILQELENRIQKLISLHKDLKSKSQSLEAENNQLKEELIEARRQARQMQDGFKVKLEERTVSSENIGQLKKKINDIISEIDKSVTLINEQNR